MEFPLAIQRKETGFSQVSVGRYSWYIGSLWHGSQKEHWRELGESASNSYGRVKRNILLCHGSNGKHWKPQSYLGDGG
jgi:hypothetical protein